MTIEIIFQLIWSASVIWIAASWLVKASDKIAKVSGLGHLFVGSLFLAAATSAPELFVDIEATLRGSPDLAAGDLLGSSLVNLILFCILSLIYWTPTYTGFPKQTKSSAWLAALLTTEVGLFIYFESDLSFRGLGLPSVIMLITYLGGMRLIFTTDTSIQTGTNTRSNKKQQQLIKPLLTYIAATVIIFFTSPFLVHSVESIASQTGLGNTFIGMSLLAVTTSFPELSSSLTAMRLGYLQLVAANIVGSNAINMMIFVAMDGFHKEGSLWSHLSKKNVIAALFVILNMTLLALPWPDSHNRFSPSPKTRLIIILVSSLSCYLILYFLQTN